MRFYFDFERFENTNHFGLMIDGRNHLDRNLFFDGPGNELVHDRTFCTKYSTF